MHIPSGAQPKDGPSAGVTMATSLVSLISGRPVKKGVGMTGEITLRGQVLPVGGIKEKMLAAHRAGLKTVILPKRNQLDLEDIPDEVKKDLKFIFAESVDDVLASALEKRKPIHRSPQPNAPQAGKGDAENTPG
jgi:ATP-dependent Lon protease